MSERLSERQGTHESLATMKAHNAIRATQKKIWIDLDNSPHVPFFLPIIEELQGRDYQIVLTGRDCFQVKELVELFHLNCKMIGHHSGKLRIRKLAGLITRAVHMAPFVWSQRPSLALSHGSRSQLMVASLLGIPTLMIGDYEHSTGWAFVRPTWFMHPAVISSSLYDLDPERVLDYPGIKEDVYVPGFKPNPSILKELGIREDDLVVTLRPAADEAHYHNPESERFFYRRRQPVSSATQYQNDSVAAQWEAGGSYSTVLVPSVRERQTRCSAIVSWMG